MAINKVQLANGTVLIDITDTTATVEKILQGYGAYGADGEWIDGDILTKTSSDIEVDDGVVTIPSGYYESEIVIRAPIDIEYYYTGSSVPTSDLGSDGDLYFKTT